MKILLIMLVVVVGMKLFAHDNETMLRPWDTRDTNTDIMKEVENRQKQRDYEKRMSDLEFELKKLKEKERMENNMPDFFKKPYIIPAN